MMVAKLYSPPTKWPTVTIPWLSIVQRADPAYNRFKHREAEYAPWYDGVGRPFYANPSKRGAYETPARTITVAYPSAQVLSQGDITGVGYDFVTLVVDSSPGTLTTRTAAQMFADISGAVPNIGYALRIVNNVPASPGLHIAPGASVMIKDRSGQQVAGIGLRAGTYCDISVQFPDAADAVFDIHAFGAPYSALVG